MDKSSPIKLTNLPEGKFQSQTYKHIYQYITEENENTMYIDITLTMLTWSKNVSSSFFWGDRYVMMQYCNRNVVTLQPGQIIVLALCRLFFCLGNPQIQPFLVRICL